MPAAPNPELNRVLAGGRFRSIFGERSGRRELSHRFRPHPPPCPARRRQPVLVSRLTRSREHDFPDGPRPKDCRRCGFTLRPGQEKRDLCSGLNQRSSVLQRSGGSLQRSSSLSAVADGGRRNREDHETGVRHTYGPYWRWAFTSPCCVCGRVDGAPADHWKTVGAGGRDPGNCLPVCTDHNDRHELGRQTWAEIYGIEPFEVARGLWRQFKRHNPDTAEKLEPHLPERRAA